MPSALPRMTAVVIPTTSPCASTSGPPELPGLIAASVWIASGIVTLDSWISRPSALTTPFVTVGPPGRFRALPMATTSSPTSNSDESPSSSCRRPSASIFRTAMSVGGSRPTTVASNSRPSSSVTVMSSTASPDCELMTWLFVTMWPSSSMMKPVPTPVLGVTCPNTSSVAASLMMCTTDGRSRSTSSAVEDACAGAVGWCCGRVFDRRCGCAGRLGIAVTGGGE